MKWFYNEAIQQQSSVGGKITANIQISSTVLDGPSGLKI